MSFTEKRPKGLTRRNFIKGTAAGAVGGMVAGAAGTLLAASPAPAAKEALCAELVKMRGHEGDMIDAYLARPTGPDPYPGVVVIHHMPGWDEATKEITRKFAYHGYAAISPDLHFREGKGTPEANSASVAAAGGMPDNRTMGDVEGAIRQLRALPYVNGKVGIIGYCSGGRQVYLAACTLKGIDAAVACYPGGVAEGPARLNARQPVDPFDYTKDLSCPLLGLFGKEDKRPSPEHMAKTEAELKKWGKTYEFHAYDKAAHAFFAVDRESYRPSAAVDGWKQVFKWFEKYLR
ncbi:MAG: dienelactone hydrolase family protein [Deltaproteobacteria bacterium]|nr:dienelactone hydrolase family protein [Deltaproteobacteria bacterium]